jgi:cation diffusion facilitator family transporter
VILWIRWNAVRSKAAKLLLAGIIVNLVLALTKIAGGFFGHSRALIADGIESSLDVLSSIMMWGAIKYAERPPDTDHPYGHGKMESLAAVAGSLLLVLAGAALGLHSLRDIFLIHIEPETYEDHQELTPPGS